MREKNNNITLSPNSTWFLLTNILTINICLFAAFLVLYTDNQNIRYICLIIFGISLCVIIFQYLHHVVCTQWTITDTQILIHKGIIFKKIDFIELFRVIDFQINTNAFLNIFKLSSITIVSQDNNTPQLRLYGLHHDAMTLINEIRQRVQVQRQKNHIYEISNR